MCNFTDDTTIFFGPKFHTFWHNILHGDNLLMTECFENNNMKLNQDKYHLLPSGYNHENMLSQTAVVIIWESNE